MGSEGIKTVDTQPDRIEEKVSLEDRIKKIEDFIKSPNHSAVAEDEQKRLALQLHHMKEYATALGDRIASVI
jgi:hypothetical protein